MTELICQQMRSMAVMMMCGIVVSLIYHVFYQIRKIHFKTCKVLDGMLELISLILSAYAIGVFLYYSDRGNIRLQDVICFFGGLMLWRKVNGKEGETSPGVREKSQSTGYQFSSGNPETKEKRKG